MKIVHLMIREKFTESISAFYDKFFNNGEHEICYINVDGQKSLINEKISISQKEIYISDISNNSKSDIKKVVTAVDGYSYIVLHSLFCEGRMLKKIALDQRLRSRIVWIEWGYDLYDWKVKVSSLDDRILRYCGRVFRTKCNSVITIFPPDIDYYVKRFPKSTAKVYYAPYCGPDVSLSLKKKFKERNRIKEKRDKGEAIYIQIGNRAYNKLKHIETLEALERFNGENIMIVLPLSYGRKKYADKVQIKAEEMFPGKNICLREFMPFNEYIQFLNNVDIVIYNSKRQIALGNIYEAIANNTKIYLPCEGQMYPYFKEKGVPVQKLEDLAQCTFENFLTDCKIEDKESFNEYIEFLSNIDIQADYWKNIFDDLRVRLEKK